MRVTTCHGLSPARNTEEDKEHMLQDGGGGGRSVHLAYRKLGKAKRIIFTSC